MSYVKIVIGDNRGNRIILPHTTWKAFIERRANVERLVQSTVSSSLTIQDLIVELVKIGNEYNVKISLNGTCLYMKPKTMLFMFELEHCVEHVYFELCQYTHGISEKFKYFITFLRQNCINNQCDAANILHKIYDKNSIIECELIAYALDNIVHAALYEK
ncbi:hypothetical protein ALC60_11152 [Trachymyrmex zeteki]|uniref:Uncharacterized protein n=1 Tax=Mycetomoellerius zeteki TaxID=64791 RepID=A0A151WPI4_9HYME|nr:hypothetical protein ALC60_11152 [Trachymyrmex zeteki]